MRLTNKETGKSKFTENEVASLLNELQLYQLELKIQNHELRFSYDYLDSERAKYINLYDTAPVGFFILDHMGVIEEANLTGVKLLGFSKSSLQNKRLQNFIFSNDLEDFYSFLNELQDADEKKSIELKLLLNNQETIYTRLEGIGMHDSASSSVKFYITIIDITENRNAQQQLKETKERLEMILKASTTGIWSVEDTSDQILLDEHSYEILDLSPSEFSGTLDDFFSLIHPEDQSNVRHSFLNGLYHSAEIDLEFRVLMNTGKLKDIVVKGRQIIVSEEHQLFAGILMDTTERKKMARETEKLKTDQQRAVLSATLNAQENERNNISRALHDSVCQILYGIRLNLQSIPQLKNLKGEFKNVNYLLDQAIRETRQISYELAPSVLKDFGFTAGIKEMAQRLSTSTFKIKANIKQSIDEIHPTIQLYVFRIVQELINNIIKHANASIAEIIVSEDSDQIIIIVSDNGQCFRVELEKALKRGSGLRGIKNQVFLLNGEINFRITKIGTAINVNFNKNIDLPV